MVIVRERCNRIGPFLWDATLSLPLTKAKHEMKEKDGRGTGFVVPWPELLIRKNGNITRCWAVLRFEISRYSLVFVSRFRCFWCGLLCMGSMLARQLQQKLLPRGNRNSLELLAFL